MKFTIFVLFNILLLICILTRNVSSHGYLLEPPARSTAWLVDDDFKDCCTYYNHMEMFCGGTHKLWSDYGGKCGICGEEWNATKKFEKGGEKYLGKVVGEYTQGESINATVVITANHYGWFEFRICNIDGWESDATQECLNKTIIRYTDTNDTRLMVKKYSSPAIVKFKLDLPPDLTCDHCVLQWKYRCGNRWGIDEATNTSCVGCGVIQEHFYGCADISIRPKGATVIKTKPTTKRLRKTTPIITTAEKIPNKPEDSDNIETTSESNESSNNNNKNNNNKNENDNNSNNNNLNDSSEVYNGCRSKLYFGKTINLSKAVSIYCSRVCKTTCGDLNNPITPTDDEGKILCGQTCPLICSCS